MNNKEPKGKFTEIPSNRLRYLYSYTHFPVHSSLFQKDQWLKDVKINEGLNFPKYRLVFKRFSDLAPVTKEMQGYNSYIDKLNKPFEHINAGLQKGLDTKLENAWWDTLLKNWRQIK